MDVVILGSGTPLPNPDRGGPAVLVRARGLSLLFDCGRAVLMRGAAAGMVVQKLTAQFLTHLHSDHTTDYNDVITTRWIMSAGPNPLPVFGPEGTAKLTDATLAALEDDIGYRLAHHDDLTGPPIVDVTECHSGLVMERDGVTVSCAQTDHRPATPTLGFRIECDEGVVAIGGDTIPCDGLYEICRGADVYVQSVIRSDLIAASRSPRLRDVLDYHSDVRQAGETAARCGVKTLVLVHFVPPPPPGKEDEWAADARAAFDGDIRVAHDLMTIPCRA